MQAVVNACRSGRLAAIPGLVISNNFDSGALRRARSEAIPWCHLSAVTHSRPEDLDEAIRSALSSHGVELVILAGYMKKIGPATLDAYRGRILNIHPALLPKFGGPGMFGRRVHEAVLAAGDSLTGATVHMIDEHYDTGPIVARREVPVRSSDTVESLAQRVLEAEHALLVDTVADFAGGRLPLPFAR